MSRSRAAAIVLTMLCTAALPASADPSADHTYLVMPFENVSEDPSLTWLSTGLALSLGEYLRGAGVTVVEDEVRAAVLEERGIPPGAALTLASVLQLGRTMRSRSDRPGPDHTLVGSFTIADGELTLRARWIHMNREYADPWIEHSGRLSDLLKVHSRLARDVAKAIEIPASARAQLRSGPDAFGDPPLLAFESYSRGMAETDPQKRLKLLRQAVGEYPNYHRAAYQAAALLAGKDRWNDAADMLDRAATDPHPYRYEYFMLKAEIAMERHRPQTAAEAAARAFEVRQTASAQILLGRAHLSGGDSAAARAALERAIAIDPADPEIEGLRSSLAAADGGGARR